MDELGERIRLMNLNEIYHFIIGEKDLDDKTRRKLRYGMDIRVDIYDYFNGSIMEKKKKGICVIQGRVFKTEDINTEMEKRLLLAREWLLNKYEKGTPVRARLGK